MELHNLRAGYEVQTGCGSVLESAHLVELGVLLHTFNHSILTAEPLECHCPRGMPPVPSLGLAFTDEKTKVGGRLSTLCPALGMMHHCPNDKGRGQASPPPSPGAVVDGAIPVTSLASGMGSLLPGHGASGSWQDRAASVSRYGSGSGPGRVIALLALRHPCANQTLPTSDSRSSMKSVTEQFSNEPSLPGLH